MRITLDPQAVLDAAFDWTAWLAPSETITSHTVTATTGVTIADHAENAGIVTVWLSDGVDGATAQLTCHVVTSEGRADDRTMTIRIANR